MQKYLTAMLATRIYERKYGFDYKCWLQLNCLWNNKKVV